jgi:hypothetical protein
MTSVSGILHRYHVNSFRHLSNGLLAIRKDGMWLYFKSENGTYVQTGSTLFLRK